MKTYYLLSVIARGVDCTYHENRLIVWSIIQKRVFEHYKNLKNIYQFTAAELLAVTWNHYRPAELSAICENGFEVV